MKLSKEQIKNHKKSLEYLSKDVLTMEEKFFVMDNWNESANHINSNAGAFFTPTELAKDFIIEIYPDSNIIDLCAGIGKLAFFAYHHKECNITCVEINKDYVEVGKKILPEATWICSSIFDLDYNIIYDQSISNPPFGNIKTGVENKKGKYKGSEFEYLTIDLASKISKCGTFILPQNSTPFKYSGEKTMLSNSSKKVEKFIKETGLVFEFNCGIDTSVHINDWNGVSPMVEIVNIDFDRRNDGFQKALF